jgi:DNA-binding beta-propeller fold protein YncE
MPLRRLGFVELPAYAKSGGFDHAAVHEPTGRVYVAHTANDAVDVIDGGIRTYLGSIENLTGVAGALVASEPELIITSNRDGEPFTTLSTPPAAPVSARAPD